MVRTGVGGVKGLNAGLEDTDAWTVEAAKNGATGTAGKGCGTHARLPVEDGTKAAPAVVRQFGSGDDVDRSSVVGQAAQAGAGGDDEVVQFIDFVTVAVACFKLAGEDGDGQKATQDVGAFHVRCLLTAVVIELFYESDFQ